MQVARGFVTRVDAMRARNRLLICAGLGALAALGQAPVDAWPLTVVGLALILGIFSQTQGWRQAAWAGWAAGTGYFMLALSWIVEPFMVDPLRDGWMAPFALLFLSGGLALFWAAAFGLARALGGGALAWVATLVLAEAARGTVLTGFPWAQPGHAWIDTPVLHWAAYAGPLGLTALILAAGAALWRMIAGDWRVAAPVLLAVAGLYATGRALHPAPDMPVTAPMVRLVQPNAPQHEKWDPDKVQGFYERQLQFTAAAGARPDLIVWPETAVPVLLNRAGQVFETISDVAGNAAVVLGVQRLNGVRLHNSMVALDGAGKVTSIYDKHHLVPFGEYIPFGDYLKQFGIKGLAAQDGNGYSAGPGAQVIGIGDLGRALALICYEGVFPQDVAAAPERPDFMLMITNDAWFGKISGPYQHLAQARLRSAEQGLPMVRVANTGVSAMIDATGRVTASIALGQAGWRDVPLPPPLPPTVYARSGDWPVLGLMLVLLGLSRLPARYRNGSNSD